MPDGFLGLQPNTEFVSQSYRSEVTQELLLNWVTDCSSICEKNVNFFFFFILQSGLNGLWGLVHARQAPCH